MHLGYVVHLWHIVTGVVGLALVGACASFGAPLWIYVLVIAGNPVAFHVVQTAWVLGSRFPQLRPHSLAVSFRTALALVQSGGWFAIMSICTVISYNIDSLVVSSILGADDAAVFAIAARMFILAGSTLSLAGQQMWPALADAISRGHVSWARSRYRHTLVLSTAVNSVGCLVLVLLGQRISELWVGEALKPPMSLLVVLGIYTVVSTWVAQSAYLLAAVEQVRTVAILGLAMTVLNVALSIAFTQHFGITGPILGSLTALVLVLVGPVVFLTRRELNRLDVVE
jgi:O-antigen/teichoic acid export membrane protein